MDENGTQWAMRLTLCSSSWKTQVQVVELGDVE